MDEKKSSVIKKARAANHKKTDLYFWGGAILSETKQEIGRLADGKANLRASSDKDTGQRGGTGTGLLTKPENKTQRPSLYKVLMLNDDYTPMEFVVHILQHFFRMTIEEATQVMLNVHNRGVGVCGIFTYEVAETKVNQVMAFARQHEQPLQCTLEKE